MTWIHVRHQVADHDAWRKVYDSTADYKRQHGWKSYQVFLAENNSNDVLVMEEFATLEQAQDYLKSDYLHEAMGNAGVVGAPHVTILESLESGSA